MWGVAAVVNAYAEMAETDHFVKRLRESKSPEETSAILSVERERAEHRKRLEIARASAPRVEVTNNIYVW